MEELISVIVPIYKVEKYLRRCIDSILNQTYSNLEVILVDDGSPDNCPAIVDEYAKSDKRIKVIHKENGGISSSRNAGLKIATGEYVAFVDSDDSIDKMKYEVLYKLIKKYDADISIDELVRVKEDELGDLIIPNLDVDNIEEKEITKSEALKMILMNNDVGNYSFTKLFKRKLFEKVCFPEGKVYEDVATLYKVVDKAEKIAYTNQKLYYYLYGRLDAITSSFSEKKIIDSLEAYYNQCEFIVKNYSDIKEYAQIIWIKMYTSAMEKILMNNYEELWNSSNVEEKYQYFKNTIEQIDEKELFKNLEPYRFVSAVLLKNSRDSYKYMFPSIFKNLKNKN
ncbi:MAG: glycosyltransferase family 2 protein [Clostridia bacterium]|nr:glycosyltransferase family 2 protein [Clostridia bacterium]